MPYRSALFAHAAAKPEAVEDHPWGHPVFKVRGKLFAGFGGEGATVTLKPRKEDLEALLALEFVRLADYVGRFGWVTVTVTDDASLDLALDLLDASYEQIAPRALRGRAGREEAPCPRDET
jgi:predicted DNA-binding protein (MmcQ/YjbR family)